MEGKVSIVFSDLDGTLVHYPKDFGAYADIASSSDGHVVVRYRDSGEERQCRVLESMTGGLAYLSERSVTLIDEIRSAGGIFVLITGARSSTYASRRAKLPVVDYEVFENGGRCIQNNVSHRYSHSRGEKWRRNFRTALLPGVPASVSLAYSDLEFCKNFSLVSVEN